MSEIIERIKNAHHIVVIAHVHPDIDSLSSASAIYTYLLTLHKKVSFFCATKELSKRFVFLPWIEKVKNSFPSLADLAVSLDCASIERLGIEVDIPLINIDHHESNNAFGDFAFVDSEAISTTKVVYDFFKTHEIKINPKMATALYAGLLDDSHGFMDEKVDGTTFAVAKELIELGADYKKCNTFVMQYLTLSAVRLKSLMFTKMELLHNAKIAFFVVTLQDMQTTGAIAQECEYALEESLYLPSVQVAVLIRQNRDLTLKVSLRSVKEPDVAKIAEVFNGGGHKHRSGFTSTKDTIELLKEKIIHLIIKDIS